MGGRKDLASKRQLSMIEETDYLDEGPAHCARSRFHNQQIHELATVEEGELNSPGYARDGLVVFNYGVVECSNARREFQNVRGDDVDGVDIDNKSTLNKVMNDSYVGGRGVRSDVKYDNHNCLITTVHDNDNDNNNNDNNNNDTFSGKSCSELKSDRTMLRSGSDVTKSHPTNYNANNICERSVVVTNGKSRDCHLFGVKTTTEIDRQKDNEDKNIHEMFQVLIKSIDSRGIDSALPITEPLEDVTTIKSLLYQTDDRIEKQPIALNDIISSFKEKFSMPNAKRMPVRQRSRRNLGMERSVSSESDKDSAENVVNNNNGNAAMKDYVVCANEVEGKDRDLGVCGDEGKDRDLGVCGDEGKDRDLGVCGDEGKDRDLGVCGDEGKDRDLGVCGDEGKDRDLGVCGDEGKDRDLGVCGDEGKDRDLGVCGDEGKDRDLGVCGGEGKDRDLGVCGDEGKDRDLGVCGDEGKDRDLGVCGGEGKDRDLGVCGGEGKDRDLGVCGDEGKDRDLGVCGDEGKDRDLGVCGDEGKDRDLGVCGDEGKDRDLGVCGGEGKDRDLGVCGGEGKDRDLGVCGGKFRFNSYGVERKSDERCNIVYGDDNSHPCSNIDVSRIMMKGCEDDRDQGGDDRSQGSDDRGQGSDDTGQGSDFRSLSGKNVEAVVDIVGGVIGHCNDGGMGHCKMSHCDDGEMGHCNDEGMGHCNDREMGHFKDGEMGRSKDGKIIIYHCKDGGLSHCREAEMGHCNDFDDDAAVQREYRRGYTNDTANGALISNNDMNYNNANYISNTHQGSREAIGDTVHVGVERSSLLDKNYVCGAFNENVSSPRTNQRVFDGVEAKAGVDEDERGVKSKMTLGSEMDRVTMNDLSRNSTGVYLRNGAVLENEFGKQNTVVVVHEIDAVNAVMEDKNNDRTSKCDDGNNINDDNGEHYNIINSLRSNCDNVNKSNVSDAKHDTSGNANKSNDGNANNSNYSEANRSSNKHTRISNDEFTGISNDHDDDKSNDNNTDNSNDNNTDNFNAINTDNFNGCNFVFSIAVPEIRRDGPKYYHDDDDDNDDDNNDDGSSNEIQKVTNLLHSQQGGKPEIPNKFLLGPNNSPPPVNTSLLTVPVESESISSTSPSQTSSTPTKCTHPSKTLLSVPQSDSSNTSVGKQSSSFLNPNGSIAKPPMVRHVSQPNMNAHRQPNIIKPPSVNSINESGNTVSKFQKEDLNSDLAKLKATALKLNLATRRPSYLKWLEDRKTNWPPLGTMPLGVSSKVVSDNDMSPCLATLATLATNIPTPNTAPSGFSNSDKRKVLGSNSCSDTEKEITVVDVMGEVCDNPCRVVATDSPLALRDKRNEKLYGSQKTSDRTSVCIGVVEDDDDDGDGDGGGGSDDGDEIIYFRSRKSSSSSSRSGGSDDGGSDSGGSSRCGSDSSCRIVGGSATLAFSPWRRHCGVSGDGDRLTPDRKMRIEKSLAWLYTELKNMRNQDQQLARQLLAIRQEIHSLKYSMSYQEHRDHLEEVQCDLEDLQEFANVLDLPSTLYLDTPLKNVGVTKWNITARRFSTC